MPINNESEIMSSGSSEKLLGDAKGATVGTISEVPPSNNSGARRKSSAAAGGGGSNHGGGGKKTSVSCRIR